MPSILSPRLPWNISNHNNIRNLHVLYTSYSTYGLYVPFQPDGIEGRYMWRRNMNIIRRNSSVELPFKGKSINARRHKSSCRHNFPLLSSAHADWDSVALFCDSVKSFSKDLIVLVCILNINQIAQISESYQTVYIKCVCSEFECG